MVNNADPNLGYQLPQDQLNGATQTLNGEEVQAMQQQVATCGLRKSPTSPRGWTRFALVWRRPD